MTDILLLPEFPQGSLARVGGLPSLVTVTSLFIVAVCLTLCEPMGCSTPGLPVLHYLPEFPQNHVH